MSFSHHLFFCLNQRSNGEDCCDRHNAFALFEYAKNRVKELGLAGPGKIRVNKAGCLEDVEEIIQSHLLNGAPVERLQLT
jgi:hypothetical protein